MQMRWLLVLGCLLITACSNPGDETSQTRVPRRPRLRRKQNPRKRHLLRKKRKRNHPKKKPNLSLNRKKPNLNLNRKKLNLSLNKKKLNLNPSRKKLSLKLPTQHRLSKSRQSSPNTLRPKVA